MPKLDKLLFYTILQKKKIIIDDSPLYSLIKAVLKICENRAKILETYIIYIKLHTEINIFYYTNM